MTESVSIDVIVDEIASAIGATRTEAQFILGVGLVEFADQPEVRALGQRLMIEVILGKFADVDEDRVVSLQELADEPDQEDVDG